MTALHYNFIFTRMPETFHAQFLYFHSFYLQLNICQLTPINKKKPLVSRHRAVNLDARDFSCPVSLFSFFPSSAEHMSADSHK